MIINMHDAKTHLSRYVEKALAGEEVILARAGEPVAALVPLDALAGAKKNSVILGIITGAFAVPDHFDALLPEEVMAAFYGEG